VNELAEQTTPITPTPLGNAEEFTGLMQELAVEEAPRLFALVEEYGDRADVNSVEGDFQLDSQSAESARTLFEISSRSTGVARVHVVWLDETTSVVHQD
jgi:hypothetical protein